LLASILLVATPVMAQVYRWVDEKGTVHYSNATPPAAVKFTIIDRGWQGARPATRVMRQSAPRRRRRRAP
ncbi:MAG TPA: DUF4124 domain-containing protein, partial [Burkholderiales bacterium]|nr:DUF4124 domain-containing protein [Burkholderiales bacterium]